MRDKEAKLIFIVLGLMLILSLLTNYEGSADIGDYADTAKFFSGNYQARLRASHSVLYGLVMSPFVGLTKNFFLMKISSIFWLCLLIFSVYFISKKNKTTLWLFLVSPVVWYIIPWITPAIFLSFLFLWSYYFIEKFEKQNKTKYLAYAGLLAGFGGAFWATSLYFSFFLLLSYFYNKKFLNSLIFLFFILIGLLPRLITDQLLFGFAFYSILKHIFSCIVFFLYGGIYHHPRFNPLRLVSFLLFIPFYSYLFYKKKNFIKYKKLIIFLTFSLAFLLTNPQIRLLIILIPIIILLLAKILNKKQFRIQLIIFLVLTLMVINPYLIQIKYETKGQDFVMFVKNFPNLNLNPIFTTELIKEDLQQIQEQYPNQSFIVGNHPDSYQHLAHLYWGDGIKEFVSIQDYELYLKNSSIIAGKKFCSRSKPWNRRDICFSAELRKSQSDKTEYEKINYALTINDNLTLQNFRLVKKYQVLSLYEKTLN